MIETKVEQSLPKSGLVECGDATGGNPNARRFAVADGVSEDPILIVEFAQGKVNEFIEATSPASKALFSEAKDNLGQQVNDWGNEIKQGWRAIAIEKLKANALLRQRWEAGGVSASTFAGVRIQENPGNHHSVDCLVVGDSYVFMISEDGTSQAVTQTKREPTVETDCIRVGKPGQGILAITQFRHGRYSITGSGYVILASDTIGAWIDRYRKANPTALIETLCQLRERDAFESFVNRLRDSGEVIDDDMALVVVGVGATREYVGVSAKTGVFAGGRPPAGESAVALPSPASPVGACVPAPRFDPAFLDRVYEAGLLRRFRRGIRHSTGFDVELINPYHEPTAADDDRLLRALVEAFTPQGRMRETTFIELVIQWNLVRTLSVNENGLSYEMREISVVVREDLERHIERLSAMAQPHERGLPPRPVTGVKAPPYSDAHQRRLAGGSSDRKPRRKWYWPFGSNE